MFYSTQNSFAETSYRLFIRDNLAGRNEWIGELEDGEHITGTFLFILFYVQRSFKCSLDLNLYYS